MQRNISFWISALATAAVVLFIVFYAIYRSQSLIKGPIIQVSSPQNGATVTLKDDQALFIEGEIRNANTVSLNDRKIFLDEHGHFSEQFSSSRRRTLFREFPSV